MADGEGRAGIVRSKARPLDTIIVDIRERCRWLRAEPLFRPEVEESSYALPLVDLERLAEAAARWLEACAEGLEG